MGLKLPPLSPVKLIRVLKQSGFELDHITGSHHIYYRPVDKRRVTVPFHKKDLPKGTILAILKQAGLSRHDILSA